MNNRFIILIGSRNNAAWVESNLGSVLSQDYTNYHVVYYDDASEDGTLEEVKKITEKDPSRFSVIHSKERKLKTWFFCNFQDYMRGELKDNDILVFLDGDDMFASENVLSYLNAIYNQSNCWMTYGGMQVWHGGDQISEPFPQNSEIPAEVIKNKAYRKDTWRTSHLKSMRGFLWNKFNKEDLRPNGQYMVGPDDLTIMYGMLEICPPDKVYRITEPVYIYNHSDENQHSRAFTDHKTIAKMDYEKWLRDKTPYDTISFVTPTLAGGLGNQMFEIAAAASLAKDNGAVCIVNNQEHILPNQGRNVNSYADNIFSRIMFDSTIQPENFYNRPICTYAPIPYSKNLKLNGHFQSWRYFDHNRDYIKWLFSGAMPPFHTSFEGQLAVQVRRGDYYKFPDHHPQLPPSYFMEAAKMVGPSSVVVFTDDSQWCKDNLDFGVPTTYQSSGTSDWEELYEMSFFPNLIIANSSFGWWGAYLNNQPNKKIFVPSIWFGRVMMAEGFNIDDLVLPDWIKVPVTC